MRTRLLTLAVWTLVAAAAVFWGLRLFVASPPLPAQAQAPMPRQSLGGDLHRLLGASPVAGQDDDEPASAGDRFRLLGVVAPAGAGRSPQGVALIAVGDQPARAWRTGSVVDGDIVLLSVSRRSVALGPRGGPASVELTLPEPQHDHAPATLPARVILPSAPAMVGQFTGVPGVPASAPNGAMVRPGPLPHANAAAAAQSNDDDED